MLNKLRNDLRVVSITQDTVNVALQVPNDPVYPYQWNLGSTEWAVDTQKLWAESTGENQTIAVIDSGITAHLDLDTKVLDGADFIYYPELARDGDSRDNAPPMKATG